MDDDDDIRQLIEDAAAFVRAGDPSGAAARARAAMTTGASRELVEAGELELERALVAERDWLAQVKEREAEHHRTEVADAAIASAFEEIAPVFAPSLATRWWRRLLRRAR